MATITAKATGLRGIGIRLARFVRVAQNLPSRMNLTVGGLAAAHHRGYVSRPKRGARRMQRAIAAKFFRGPGQRPPSLAKLRSGLRTPARPINATVPMQKALTAVMVAQLFGKKGESREQVMRADVQRQQRVGGDPAWTASKVFGSSQPARPTLGGPSSTIGRLWGRARYSEAA